jgi:hypothetical protein
MVRQALVPEAKQSGLFIRYIWFYLFFFFLLVMIASFGLIAEA